MSQYYFDISDKSWWMLPEGLYEWQQISNVEAYKLGLFSAVLNQPCRFIDTNLQAYTDATSSLVRELHAYLEDYGDQTSSADEEKLASDMKCASISEPVTALPSTQNSLEIANSDSGVSLPVRGVDCRKATQRIHDQLNLLIASTASSKSVEQEKTETEESFVRCAVRHATSKVDRGTLSGLADCIKAVGQQRQNLKETKLQPKAKPPKTDSKLQEMMKRARSLANKTLDSKDSSTDIIMVPTQQRAGVSFEDSSDEEKDADEKQTQGMQQLLGQRLSIRRKTGFIQGPLAL